MPETPNPAQDRDLLIAVAVRPFAENAELRLAAAAFLEKTETSNQERAADAVLRWQTADATNFRSFWKTALWVMLLTVSVVVWSADSDEFVPYYQWVKWSMNPYSEPQPDSSERVSRGLCESDKLLLFGDSTRSNKDERMEALWRSEPENPAYFAEYAMAYVGEHGELPPDFSGIVQRIDPENAWFNHLAAAVEAKGAVKQKDDRVRAGNGRPPDEAPPGWEVLDQARLDRSLKLLRQARAQSKCEGYSAAMLRKRLAILPNDSVVESLLSIGVLAANTEFAGIRSFQLVSAINAKAWMLGESGDVDGFRELAKDTEAFLRGASGMEAGTLLEQVVFCGFVKVIASSFAPAAEKLGLQDQAVRWKQIDERMRDWNKARRSRVFLVDGKVVDPRRHSGILYGDSLKSVSSQVEHPPLIRAVDLKPNRLIDHEMFSLFFGYAIWILIGLCLGLVAAWRFRVAVMVRRLARRMEQLIGPIDWAWIVGAGVLLPFGFVMAINRLTPLGGRDFGMVATGMLLPTGHFLGLLVLWLILPVVLIRWRLAKRAGFFGFSHPGWWAWLTVICAAAFVPLIGWVAISCSPGGFWKEWMNQLGFVFSEQDQHGPQLFWWGIGLLAVPVFWLVITVCRAAFGRRLFHRMTASLLLVRAYAGAMLLVMLATAGFKAAERYWFHQDHLMTFDSSAPGWSRYEYLVAAQMREELREILEHDP